MKNTLKIALIISSILIYIGCKKTDLELENYSETPVLPAPMYNYENSSNDALATLGRVLFFDKKMSLNNSVSCGTCHQQSKAFCDNKQFSPGLQDQLTRRNTPTVIRHFSNLFWDGRATDFHSLALMPLVNHVEMKNYDLSKLEAKVSDINYYPALFNSAFGTPEVTIDKIQQGLAAFLVNFTFSDNKFFAVQMGQQNFTAQEQIGRDLFWGKAKCGNCHAGMAFEGWGGNFECIGLDESYQDNGVGELTLNEGDNAKFRVPPLLNIEFTGPYMHDGRFNTLEEVVEHYNSGIKAHPNLSWALNNLVVFDSLTSTETLLLLDLNHDGIISANELPPVNPVRLGLTEGEKKALVAFLKTLSDYNVFTDIRFSDPFKIK